MEWDGKGCVAGMIFISFPYMPYLYVVSQNEQECDVFYIMYMGVCLSIRFIIVVFENHPLVKCCKLVEMKKKSNQGNDGQQKKRDDETETCKRRYIEERVNI